MVDAQTGSESPGAFLKILLSPHCSLLRQNFSFKNGSGERRKVIELISDGALIIVGMKQKSEI
jgi:hypothetical protein